MRFLSRGDCCFFCCPEDQGENLSGWESWLHRARWKWPMMHSRRLQSSKSQQQHRRVIGRLLLKLFDSIETRIASSNWKKIYLDTISPEDQDHFCISTTVFVYVFFSFYGLYLRLLIYPISRSSHCQHYSQAYTEYFRLIFSSFTSDLVAIGQPI